MKPIAKKFIESAEIAWDSFEPWENTAKFGLSAEDRRALARIGGNDDDEKEIVEYCRNKTHFN